MKILPRFKIQYPMKNQCKNKNFKQNRNFFWKFFRSSAINNLLLGVTRQGFEP